MARFSVGGNGGNQDRPSNSGPLLKRLRLSNPVCTQRTVTPGASISNSSHRATTSAPTAVLRPEEPVAAQEGSEELSSDESETSWSESSTDSEEESDEEEQQQNQRSGNQAQSTEARANSAPNGNGTCRESEPPSGINVTLMDPDVLDCPICYEPLYSPVYQCENGHIACASCCTLIKIECPSCTWPIGYNRCRAIEKVLDSIRIACRNTTHGCIETLNYSKKQAHETTCNYIPCSCPFLRCDYTATSKSVYSRFALEHSLSSRRFMFNTVTPMSLDSAQKTVFLQDYGQTTLFVLNRHVETVESVINVVCIGPGSEKRPFSYELTAIAGESSIKLKTFVDFVPKWTAQSPKKMCLIVPSDFISRNKLLKLELIIRKNPVVPR